MLHHGKRALCMHNLQCACEFSCQRASHVSLPQFHFPAERTQGSRAEVKHGTSTRHPSGVLSLVLCSTHTHTHTHTHMQQATLTCDYQLALPNPALPVCTSISTHKYPRHINKWKGSEAPLTSGHSSEGSYLGFY